MNTPNIDLSAYVRRIGYEGDAAPTLATLRALHQLHARSIAFENLDPLLRRPVSLDPAALERKLVHAGRGGYCFEQNGLLLNVLRALGFRVTGLGARVLWMQSEDAITPRSHMLLHVQLDEGDYLADVGFGGLTLTDPLRFATDLEQQTSLEPFRLLALDRGYKLQVKLAGDWRTQYRFELTEQYAPDYEVGNWYVSTHPNSHFVQRLIVARPHERGRYALAGRELARYDAQGGVERTTLTSTSELHDALTDLFQITLPEGPELDTLLTRIAQG